MSTKSNTQPYRRLLNLAVLMALGCAALAPGSASAAVFIWNCPNNFWGISDCWSPLGVPTASDSVFVIPGAANTTLGFDNFTGTQSANSLMVNSDTANTISMLQTGGSLTIVTNQVIGTTGTGSYALSGGTNMVKNFLTLGANSGSNGSYALSGTGSLSAGFEIIGDYGTGTFTQSGFQHAVSNFLILGANSGSNGSNGSYTLTSGFLSARAETVGSYGTGTFIQSGGSNTANSGLTLGALSGSNGSYTLTSGTLSAGSETVGNRGTGTFTQSGGTNTMSNGDLVLGYDSTGNGSYVLSGNSGLLTGGEIIGRLGTGAFTQSSGTHTIKTNLTLGAYSSDSNGSYILNSGSLSVKWIEKIGDYGTGTFTQNGGEHTVGEHMMLAANAGSSGTYNLTGGTLAVLGGINNFAGGSFHVGAGTTATVGGAGFFNRHGGLLGGAGTIIGNVTSDGIVGPGNSPGALSIIGNYTQSALGTYSVEIGGLLAGTQYDTLNIAGTATIDGLLNVSLFNLGGGLFRPHAGDYFDILTASTIMGSFSSLSFAALSDPSLFWQLDYLTDAIGTTDVVRLSVAQAYTPATPVPEPETYAMLLAGLGLVGFMARRRKSATA